MLSVHCYCCSLKRLKLWLKLWLMLMLYSAHKQGKRGEGFTCSNSHTKANANGERRRLVRAASTGAPRVHHSLTPCLCLLLPLLAPELPLPSHGLSAEQPPFTWGLRLQEQGQGVHTGTLGALFENHPQNLYK